MPQINLTEEQKELLLSLLGGSSVAPSPVDKTNPLFKILDLTKRKTTELKSILQAGSHMERHHIREALVHLLDTVDTMYDKVSDLSKPGASDASVKTSIATILKNVADLSTKVDNLNAVSLGSDV